MWYINRDLGSVKSMEVLHIFIRVVLVKEGVVIVGDSVWSIRCSGMKPKVNGDEVIVFFICGNLDLPRSVKVAVSKWLVLLVSEAWMMGFWLWCCSSGWYCGGGVGSMVVSSSAEVGRLLADLAKVEVSTLLLGDLGALLLGDIFALLSGNLLTLLTGLLSALLAGNVLALLSGNLFNIKILLVNTSRNW